MPGKGKRGRSIVDDLRGASRLATDATTSVTELVEEMHAAIGGGPAILGRPLERPLRVINGLVYGTIRGVTTLVGAGIDAALAELAPLIDDAPASSERDAVLAALNGVLGDYLKETQNPLAIEMELRHGGEALELRRASLAERFPSASGRVIVLVHGSSMNDAGWKRNGHDHGASLANDLGATAVYVRYNSGLHISTNGRELASLLESLASAWPVPVDAIFLVGHSMGGLVARSACSAGEEAKHVWRTKLRALACLGSPHHGAPLERGGNWIDVLLGVTRESAPLAKLARIRSAGVTDLRYGNVADEHWEGRDRFVLSGDPRRALRLPVGVACYALAATLSKSPSKKLRSDGLVPVDSALGRHERAELALAFAEEHQWIGFGMGHLDLLDRREAYEALRGFLCKDRAEMTLRATGGIHSP